MDTNVRSNDETYRAQGICSNCGRRNYPQWGTYNVGTRLEDNPCPNCGLMTWGLDKEIQELNKK